MITHASIYEFLANNETLTIEERQMITEYVGQQIKRETPSQGFPRFVKPSYNFEMKDYDKRIRKLELKLKHTKGLINRSIIKDDIRMLKKSKKEVEIMKLVDEECELENDLQ